jgi:hypothetical protein
VGLRDLITVLDGTVWFPGTGRPLTRSAEDILNGPGESISQFLISHRGERCTGEEEAGEDDTDCTCHPDPVTQRHPRVGEDRLETSLEVLVRVIVLLLAVELLMAWAAASSARPAGSGNAEFRDDVVLAGTS